MSSEWVKRFSLAPFHKPDAAQQSKAILFQTVTISSTPDCVPDRAALPVPLPQKSLLKLCKEGRGRPETLGS